jgi:hypothetical protein
MEHRPLALHSPKPGAQVAELHTANAPHVSRLVVPADDSQAHCRDSQSRECAACWILHLHAVSERSQSASAVDAAKPVPPAVSCGGVLSVKLGPGVSASPRPSAKLRRRRTIASRHDAQRPECQAPKAQKIRHVIPRVPQASPTHRSFAKPPRSSKAQRFKSCSLQRTSSAPLNAYGSSRSCRDDERGRWRTAILNSSER